MHDGLNSVMESLYYGVPMIVLPLTADQPVNGNRVEELGFGKKLEYGKMTYKILHDAAFDVLNNTMIEENISYINNTMRAAGGNRYGAEAIMEYMNEQNQQV